jgi:hypothetical protein
MTTARSIGRAVGLLGLGYVLVYRPWQRSWGATGREVTETLPGDDLVPRPQWEATRAVDIDAAPEDVWPWLAQIGANPRAGWYSYDWVDNRRIPSATRIRPDLQDLAVGDVLPMTAGATGGFVVEDVDPGRCLVLRHRHEHGVVVATFVLRPRGAHGSRLVHRIRFRVPGRSLAWAALMDAGDFLMSRRMLIGIRKRAQRRARHHRLGPEPSDDAPGTPLTYDLSVPVRKAPEVVWNLLADIQDVEPIPEASGVRMVKEPVAPTGVGTRWHEHVRLAPGAWMLVESTVTEARPPEVLAMDFRSRWFSGHLAYVVEPTPTGCRLHQRETLELRPGLRGAAARVDALLRPRLLDRLAEVRDVTQTLHR